MYDASETIPPDDTWTASKSQPLASSLIQYREPYSVMEYNGHSPTKPTQNPMHIGHDHRCPNALSGL